MSGEPTSTVQLLTGTPLPSRRLPADWEFSGAAFGRATWSVTVHADLDERDDVTAHGMQRLAEGGGMRVMLRTPLGDFQGYTYLVATVVDGDGVVLRLRGEGPLAFVLGPGGAV